MRKSGIGNQVNLLSLDGVQLARMLSSRMRTPLNLSCGSTPGRKETGTDLVYTMVDFMNRRGSFANKVS